MKKIESIIITNGVNECVLLHNHIQDFEFEKALTRRMYPTDPKFYQGTWYWWFDDGGSIRGNSGSGALETAVRLSPGARIYLLSDFLKLNP